MLGKNVEVPIVEIRTTPAQRDMWLLSQLNGHARRAYNESMKLRLEGALDRAALVQALRDVVARHEILRASFNADGTAVAITPTVAFEVPYVDFQPFAEKRKSERLAEWLRGEASAPFDLSRAPLLRAALARVDDEQHVLVLTLHHLIVDQWSNSVLIGDLARLYNAAKTGAPPPPLPEKTFRDYVAWSEETARTPQNAAAEEYWVSRFEGALPVLDLPGDRPRPPVQRFAGELAQLEIDAALLRDVTRASRKHGATLFATLLAVFKCLLHRLSGQRDLVVGILTAGQAVAKMPEVVGYCANLLPIRTQVDGNPTFAQYLSAVRSELFGALTRPQVPFGRLLTMLDVPRDRSRPPLVNVIFSLGRQSPDDARFAGLATSLEGNHAGEAQYDLTVRMTQNPDDLRMDVAYNSDIFDRATIERWLAHFRTMLAAVAADTGQRVGAVPWLSAEDKHRLLVEWNGRATQHPGPDFIHQWIAAQAARTPDAIAVCFEEARVTYRELEARANQLAHGLRHRGVGPEVRVGVSIDRSIELVVALLGVLKAGGAYVPLDLGYPEERLRYVSEDAQLHVRLTREDVLAAADQPVHAPDVALHPANAAYMIYTSGSTGNPKGAIISHEAIRNRLSWMQSQFGLQAGEGVLQKTPSSFDVSVWEFFWPLMVGARLVVARPGGHKEPDYLAEIIAKQAITTIHFVPSMLQVFLGFSTTPACAAHLRRVICSGEALGAELARRFGQILPGVALHNLYGPTEAAVDVTHWACDPQSESPVVPIGTPVDNTRIHLLDAELHPVPIGVRGELYIGGIQVGRGYHRRAALTAERFIPDPFSPVPGARMYRTGDVGRYLPNGAIEYGGRTDTQVKLRGHRIELGEIEAALRMLPEVRDAAAQLVGEPQDARIVAYLELAQALPDVPSYVRLALEESLPSFMVPSAFVVLPQLPLTPSGKLDRRALPAPGDGAESKRPFEPPQTEVERVLAAQWEALLKRKTMGRRDDFFRTGGHSLLAVQAISRANEAFGVRLALPSLFDASTLASFAERIEQAQSGTGLHRSEPVIQRAARGGVLPLSYAQQRLWFLEQLEPGNTAYNIPCALRIRGPLDVGVLQRVFREVVRRHDVLRTTFVADEGEAAQVVHDTSDWAMPVDDLQGHPEDREGLVQRFAQEEAEHVFDLGEGPLLRTRLLRLGADEHVLAFTMHHIVSDGWSVVVLVKEIGALYEAFVHGLDAPLEELRVQYADFAAWQRTWLDAGRLEEQLAYWTSQLRAAEPLDLPTDRAPSAVSPSRAACVRFALSEAITRDLRQLCDAHQVTLFMALVASFQVLLHRYTGQDDVCVGTPVANRHHAEIEPLIGFFVNTLVLRGDLSGRPTFVELLERTRRTALAAYAHQDAPFEKVFEAVDAQRGPMRTPLFRALFDFQNGTVPLAYGGLQIERLEVPLTRTMFDLNLSLVDEGDRLTGGLTYDENLWDRESIEPMAEHFQRLTESIVRSPGQRIGMLPWLSPEEREHLLAQGRGSVSARATGTLHERFEEQARRTPDAEAVLDARGHLTFRELDGRANRLARHLRERGVGPEVRVGLLLERSRELVVGILGILKAGGAYVPLDPGLPRGRLAQLIQTTAMPLLVAPPSLRGLGLEFGLETVLIDEARSDVALEPRVPSTTTGSHAAYVIFTSGSTGVPKSVWVEHGSVLSFWRAQTGDAYGGGPTGTRVALNAPLTFDASVQQWVQLLNGRTLVMVPEDVKLDAEQMVAWLDAQRIDVVDVTPTQLRTWLDAGFGRTAHTPGYVFIGGEAVDDALWARLGAMTGTRFVNTYGPTECTVDATACPVDARFRSALGEPLANVHVYVLDAELNPVPTGVSGELCVAGRGVSRGYLGQPGRTAECFVPNPWGEPGTRLYRTGDLVRRGRDGRLHYIGRADDQVKVRGHRVELGEIESCLAKLEGVDRCVAMVRRDDTGDERLVAYLVTAAGRTFEPHVLRAWAKDRLPAYMVPSAFVELASLPLTRNGKVDKRALPMPEQRSDGRDREPPRTSIERAVAAQWSALLHVENVGREDNFFELGGHSLLATRAISRANASFGLRIPLRALFEKPTLAGFSSRVEDALDLEEGEL